MNNDIKFISPFKRLCVTIGNLPTAYMESMSYYECLTFFMKFLENQVIPAINNNSEVVKELQDFVANYFDNLNVQTEIDNKLDEMATDGTLAEIINQEIFDDLNLQVEANTNDISDIQDDLNLKNNKKYLLIGDSYATGYQGSGVDPIEGFFDKVVDQLDLDATILAGNGYGFIGMSSGLTWKSLVQNATISDKDKYTDIIIAGGMNDRATDLGMQNAMEDTFTYLKSEFPNAIIHVACIGRYSKATEQNILNMRRISTLYKIISIANGHKYVDNSELILHNLNWFISDGIHPNASGEIQLAYGIEQYIVNSKIDSFMSIENPQDYQSDSITSDSANIDLSHLTLYSFMTTENVNFFINGYITFNNAITLQNLDTITIGKLTNSYLCASTYNQGLNEFITAYVYQTSGAGDEHFVKVNFRLFNDNENNIKLRAFLVKDDSGINDLEITEINIPYGGIKCIANSRYC